MLTIRPEIKVGERNVDGTYNIKLRFTLNRKVKRLSTSLFIKPEEMTKTGNFGAVEIRWGFIFQNP